MDAHEIWAAAQLAPGEGIADGVARIAAILRLAAPQPEPVAWIVFWGVGDMAPHYPLYKTRQQALDAAKEIKSYTEVRPLYATPPAIDGFGGNLDEAFAPVSSMDYGMFIDERTNPPADMVMVPREPTPEMVARGWHASRDKQAGEAVRAGYRTMIAAAPAPAVPLTDERAAFEAWADKTWGDRIVSRDYAWLGWKARAAHGIGGGGK